MMRHFAWLLVALASAALLAVATAADEAKQGEQEQGWTTIFDGRTLQGWKANESPETWSVKDGAIVADGPVSHLFYVGPDGDAELSDFELKLEVRTAPNTNSGVFFRQPWQDEGWLQRGMEAQIQNSGTNTCYTGGLWVHADRAEASPVKDGEWFELHIIAAGEKVTVKVNGEVTTQYDLSKEKRGFLKDRKTGFIALQGHGRGHAPAFRNIRLRTAGLGASAAAANALGMPLRDAFITRAPDGTFCLTGTAGTPDKTGKIDFDYNRGAPLWTSEDGKAWAYVGYAWDRVRHFERRNGRPKLGIWLDWSAPADRIDGLLAQATTTPKLYRVGDAWYMLCAMNGQNIIVQKSTSGKPEGPYEDHSYLVTRGGHPSLFIDGDATYLVYADGWIARVEADLAKLAEVPRLMRPAAMEVPGDARLTLGDTGVAVFKRGGVYCALAARRTVRAGRPSHDAVLWTADSVYGPYAETDVVLVGTGPVTVFQDAEGAWQAVSSKPCEGAPRIQPIPQPTEEVQP